MKGLTWEARLGIVLVLISIVIYSSKYLILGDPENTYNYIFNALGFLPISVLLVTLILNQLLTIRSKQDKLEKLNMVIGIFFSEVGTELLTYLSTRDPNLRELQNNLIVTEDWSEGEFEKVQKVLRNLKYGVDIQKIDLNELQTFLHQRRDFLLRLLENPVLLEHESFTGLLRAVFHLAEELDRRDTFKGLPITDYEHLAGDINRVYGSIVFAWLDYMRYLKKNYPYLFSLAMRTNPFDESASAVVR